MTIVTADVNHISLFILDKIPSIFNKNMAEEEGFEPPRALTPLSVFKTDPFSRAWVFLHIIIIFLKMMDLAGLEPATGRL